MCIVGSGSVNWKMGTLRYLFKSVLEVQLCFFSSNYKFLAVGLAP